MAELLFVAVALGKELIEGAFTLDWRDFECDACHDIVAGGKKTCGVALRMITLCR